MMRGNGLVSLGVALVCHVAACGDERDGLFTADDGASISMSASSPTGSGPNESGGHDTDGPSSTGTTSDAQTDDDDDGPTKFDLGNHDVPLPEAEGCDKVDLLFIIDNSGSMADEQVNIAASVPGFVEGIQNTLAEADSYNVGVITTDAYSGNAGGYTAIGSLVTQTSGTDSSNAVCTPFADGFRFMTQNDDLDVKFACAARPGTSGDGDERPMDAVRAALSPALNAGGACNAGFLRDDALLVLVFITDEEDDHETIPFFGITLGSAGHPPDWFADIVARKAGIEENIVVLSLVGHPKPNACPANQWDGFDGAEIATRIIEFTNMFTHGFIGDVCAPSYTAFFDEAISVIDTACSGFTPPG
jgi:hypothetical protein